MWKTADLTILVVNALLKHIETIVKVNVQHSKVRCKQLNNMKLDGFKLVK